MTTLFDPVTAGDLHLANRIVMAPLTRNRAPGQLPNALMRDYYRQRANPATGAGLIITEATQVGAMGQGYLDTPGIHSPAQVAAWRPITAAVHAVGGRIVCQLWHVGRISHSSLLPGGAAPVSSTISGLMSISRSCGSSHTISETRSRICSSASMSAAGAPRRSRAPRRRPGSGPSGGRPARLPLVCSWPAS